MLASTVMVQSACSPSLCCCKAYSSHTPRAPHSYYCAGTLSYNIQLVNGTAAAGNSTAAAGNRTTGSANISAWHDIPLDLQTSPDGTVTINTMVEIPTGEQAKYETQVRYTVPESLRRFYSRCRLTYVPRGHELYCSFCISRIYLPAYCFSQ